MSQVQGSHGRNQTDAAALLSNSVQMEGEVVAGSVYDHSEDESSKIDKKLSIIFSKFA
jgi:hypothetical protein